MSSSDNLLLQTGLQILVAVSVPVLVGLGSMLLRAATQKIQASLSAEQLGLADSLTRQFVRAAEQYNLSGILKMVGSQKKTWVIAQVTRALEARGIQIDVGMLADLVESAVLAELKAPTWQPAINVPASADPPQTTRLVGEILAKHAQ